MSDNTRHQRNVMTKLCSHLFAVATVLFVLGGAIIVVGQTALFTFGQGVAAMEFAETVGPFAFGMSSIAGLLAFALTYVNKEPSSDDA